MTKEITTTLKGESGITYFFNISPWESFFQPLGAVYAVLSKNRNKGAYKVIYVGQTGDLSKFFGVHVKKSCLDYYRRTHIGVHIEPDEEKRLLIEADLIVNYKPVCNH